ncbi:MAG: CRTAC1 family protein [Verrucomicrobiae bacterium]|nr:CRTAC1 family protein [Verrucomicrobiae bacterium]
MSAIPIPAPTLVALMALAVGLTACGPQTTPRPDPALPTSTPLDPPWFEDVTDARGLAFHHVAGTRYFMPDQVGSGIAILDFDNDGLLDLYLVQLGGPDSPARNSLWRQRQDGTFEDVSAGSGLDITGLGMGAFAADLNNDGWTDLVVTEYGGVRVFQNLGNGRFQEVTAESGLDHPGWAAPAAFLDFDRDGRLDVVIGNYLDYDPTQVCHDSHGRQDFCAPHAFPPTLTRLWRNTTSTPGATPTFEDHTVAAGLAAHPGAALGLLAADLDGDGWPDIFCADDGRPNRLFINRRDGTFREEAVPRGLALNAMGRPAADMGVAWADVDGDGRPDLFVTHLAEEFHSLFRQDAPGLFLDAVAQAGLQQQAWRGTGFGTVLADFDLDGAPDLAIANGLVRRATPGQTPVLPGVPEWWARYAQRPQLFANDGRGRFRDVSEAQPSFTRWAMVGRSLAVADLDNDGAPDLVLAGTAGPVRLFRNIAPRRGRWVLLRLIDPAVGGRDAIGAQATVVAGSRRFIAVLQPATSYLSSHDPRLHFGLGPVTAIDRVEVRWPDGTVESFSGIPLDRLTTLPRGSGRPQAMEAIGSNPSIDD